ncbi:hypothetical protein [Limnoglobus roseus]|nr:hypothetical protein [Limnoglobus roseus]
MFSVVNLTTAAVHANLVDSPKDAKRKTGQGREHIIISDQPHHR